jgi:uncharacterized protein (TIRG00374 family)
VRHVARRNRPDPHVVTAGRRGDAPGPGEPTPTPSVAPRTIVLGVVLIVVLAVGLVLLLGKAAGYREVLDALEGANGFWLLACLALDVVAYAGYVVSMRAMIASDGGPRLDPVSAIRVWFASVGATRLVSPGGAGGIAVVYWLLRRAGLGARAAVGRVLGFNILVFAILGTWAWATAVIIAAEAWGDAPLGIAIPWIVLVPGFVIAALWVSQGARGERLASDVSRGWMRKGLAGAVAGLIVARRAVAPPNLPALLGALVFWTADVACLWAALMAIGADVAPHEVALAYATAYVALLFPLPTGGYGAIDAAATFTLTVLGVPLAEAVVGVVVWRFFNFWLPTLPGLVALARAQNLGRRLAARATPPAARISG